MDEKNPIGRPSKYKPDKTRIPLTNGLFAKIDEKDYDLLSKFKWQAEKHKHTYYAGTTFKNGIRVRMHRFILDAKNGVVDHINNDGLDNRRSNIRLTSQSVNRRNSRKSKEATSKYIGVYFCKSRKKWVASIKHNGKYFNLGRYETEDLAYSARLKFELENGYLK